MSYLAKLYERLGKNTPGEEPTKLTKPGSVGFVGIPSGHIPDISDLPLELELGLDKLPTVRAARGVQPSLWRQMVQDALRLRDDGWAKQALAMGWPALHLFGWSGSEYVSDYSLVEWLRGRDVRAILRGCSATAGAIGCFVIEGNDGQRVAFNMRPRPIERMLWEAGQ